MFIIYIQNNEDKAEQTREQQSAMSYARAQKLEVGCVYADKTFAAIKELIPPAAQGVLICHISNLGASLQEIAQNLRFCQERGLTLLSAEDGYCFNKQNLTDDFFYGVEAAIDIRSRLISQNTKKVLQQKKKSGVKLGRKYGARVKRSLDGKEAEIRQLLAQGTSKAELARRLGVSRITVYNFINRNQMQTKEEAHAGN